MLVPSMHYVAVSGNPHEVDLCELCCVKEVCIMNDGIQNRTSKSAVTG